MNVTCNSQSLAFQNKETNFIKYWHDHHWLTGGKGKGSVKTILAVSSRGYYLAVNSSIVKKCTDVDWIAGVAGDGVESREGGGGAFSQSVLRRSPLRLIELVWRLPWSRRSRLSYKLYWDARSNFEIYSRLMSIRHFFNQLFKGFF